MAESGGDSTTNGPQLAATVFSARLNISAILVMAALTVFGVKLSAFLPQSYYFTLTSLVGGDRASPFIISTPVLLTNEEVCERAAKKGIQLDRLCWDDEEEDDDVKQVPSSDQSALTPKPPPNIGEKLAEQKPTTQNPGEKTNAPTPTAPVAAPTVLSKEEQEAKLRRELEEQLRQERKERKESAVVRAIQTDAPKGKSVLALFLRCLIPLVAAGIVAKLYGSELLPEVGLGSVLAVFVLFWPVAYLWNDLSIAPEWNDKLSLFMVLYFAYAVLFYFLARVGVQLGHSYFRTRAGKPFALDIKKMIESFIPGLFAGIVVQLIVFLLLK